MKTDNKCCKICLNEYNLTNQKPMTIMLCGHTFCLKCLTQMKTLKEYICPTCREEIISEKPNYALLEAIELNGKENEIEQNLNELIISSKPIKTKSVILSEEKVTTAIDVVAKPVKKEKLKDKEKIKLFSANHSHAFVKLNRDNGWKCNGDSIFGKCKSGLDKFNLSFGKARFKCTECADFDLCSECLNAEKPKEYSTLNHEHSFVKLERQNGWKCSGSLLFGKCKSNPDDFNSSNGKTRYRCLICPDFDLCYKCLNS